MALSLETSLQFVKGIGPRIAQTLQDKRITTVEDLLYHLPFRYEDRLRPSGTRYLSLNTTQDCVLGYFQVAPSGLELLVAVLTHPV